MFLTCLLNSSPPTFKRNSFGILFHCFAVKYLKEFNPYFVVFTFGSDSVTSLFIYRYLEQFPGYYRERKISENV